MIIRKPKFARQDEHNRYTTLLHFEGGPPRKYYMRGAIAWPEGDKEGFSLLAGLDTISKIIYIFEEFQFWMVNHWLDDDGSIHQRTDEHGNPTGEYHTGLCQFMQNNYTKYKAYAYFWGGQHIDIWQRYGGEVYKNRIVPRALEMIEVPYVAEVGDNLIAEYQNTDRIKGDQRSKLYVMLQEAAVSDNNGVQALRALLAGYEHQPWVNITQ